MVFSEFERQQIAALGTCAGTNPVFFSGKPLSLFFYCGHVSWITVFYQ
jgi:hypothetical protein